ncbi:pyridoxine 5'-phosphate synthase [Suttonella sp. R2A3]|uniref:pyridoxine 5'-phosphate synthase n=1 Tax=Suttonella sp. R2A3 TaxID=2908648 RepID=UPI001F2F14E5|nr:pyridoxine 5'-phosphate synthase [Suttonella sp. R2A3]UJF25007.1 pyridoxine 5'-phosphate synthase [Suttonella sp. R2A3]
MTALSVNLNKIALLRNARGRDYPNVADFAHLALQHGAAGVTIHPRPDQRHATYADIETLAVVVADYDGAELNIEGYPNADFLDAVCAVRPAQVTLVPDAPGQLTSDHGWAVREHRGQLTEVVARLHEAGIRVSLFMDCQREEIAAAQALGVARIELHTEPYARAFEQGGERYVASLATFTEHTAYARSIGLGVNAGHDLDLANVAGFVRACQPDEVSIGHALTVEALTRGFAATVAQYHFLLQASSERKYDSKMV